MKLNYAIIAFLIGIAMLTASVSAEASIGYNQNTGYAPLTVQFADHSTPLATTWNWSFGDGNFSEIKNPSHVYMFNGTFQVSLTESNGSVSNTTVTTITVLSVTPTPSPTVSPTQTPTVTPVANFIITPNPVQTGAYCAFTDTSTGNPTTWSWAIFHGGGTQYSPGQDAAYIYFTPGSYRATLTVSNANGTSTYSQNVTVVAAPTPAPTTVPTTIPTTTPTTVPTTSPTVSPTVSPTSTPTPIPSGTNQSLIVFRPGNGDWFFDNNKDGVVDKRIHFGTGGDEPHYFDWNGDGVKDMIVFRPSNGNWYVDTNQDGQVDVFLHFGTMGDISVIGT